ncbi:hypothetical protein, partial [Salmonella enterica]|uniref:hypothetical protein n=1 Tax=Salmonella enterica TaxID=28901 RepID=UPI001CB76913
LEIWQGHDCRRDDPDGVNELLRRKSISMKGVITDGQLNTRVLFRQSTPAFSAFFPRIGLLTASALKTTCMNVSCGLVA